MPDKDKTVEANGKTFTFPANTPNEEISQAVDDYFSSNPTTEPLKKKEPSIASPLLSNSTDGVSESSSEPNRFNFLTGQNDIAPEPVKAPLEIPIGQPTSLRAATTPLETTAKDITNFDPNIAQKQEELNPKKEALARGVAKAGSLLLQSPTFAYDAAVSTTNYLLNKPLGLPDAPTWKQLSDTDESLYKTAISDLEGAVNRSSQEHAKRYDKEINQYFFGEKKDLSKGFDLLSENIIESIPSSIGLAFAASQNPTAAAALGTAAFGADNKRQLDESVLVELYMPEDQKVMWSSLMGGTEMAMESLGITKLGPMFKDVLKKSGKEAVEAASKELFDKSVGKILKQYLGVQAEEVSSEMANTFLQNIYAKASGLDENRKPMDGVWDSGLTAFGQGAGMTAPTAALDIAVTKAARKKASDIQDQKATLQQDLQSPDVSDEAKKAISAKLRTVNEQEADLVAEEKSKLEALSPDQKTEVDLLNQQANKIATAATDENISKQTKEILKQDLDEVDKKVEKIFSEPKGAEVADQAQDIADEIDYLNEVKANYGKLSPEEQARMDELNPPEKLGEPQVESATETGLVEGEQKAEPIELNPNIETAVKQEDGAGSAGVGGDVEVPKTLSELKLSDETTQNLENKLKQLELERTNKLIENKGKGKFDDRLKDEIDEVKRKIYKRENELTSRRNSELETKIKDGSLLKLINDNKITAEDARGLIIESGMEVPSEIQSIVDKNKQDKKENKQSIIERDTDFLGNEKEAYMVNNDKANGVRTQEDVEYFKSNVKRAIDSGKYQKAIADGKMTANDAKIIIESYGLKVPKDILEQSLKETTKAETTPTTSNVGVEEGSGVSENPALKDVESTAKALDKLDKSISENIANTIGESLNKKKAKIDVENNSAITSGGKQIKFRISKNTDTEIEQDFLTITAVDNNGNKVGYAKFIDNGKNNLEGSEVEVPEKYQKQGISSAIYSYADAKGYNVKESVLQTPEGRALWKSLNTKEGSINSISEAYHKAKADGSNPELVKAVEEALTPTPEVSKPVSEVVTPIEEKPKPKVEKPADTTSLKEEDDLLETEKADDNETVKRLNDDISLMKTFPDNEKVEKKFMGMLERAYKAKVEGKISRKTYTSFKNKAKDILEAKYQISGKKVDYIEAKAKSNELFNKVKEKLIGQDYKKITLSSTIPITPQHISDLIDLTNNLVNRGIEVYGNIDIALEKALATIKKNPAYKRLLASGELKEADFDKAIKEANKEIKKEETPEPKEEPVKEPKKEPVKEKTESKEKPTSKEAGIEGEKRERATNERIYDSSRFKDASKLVDKKLDEYDSVSQEKAIEYINTKLDEFESEGLLHDLALELNKPEGEKVFPESISLVAPVLLADRLSAMAERETNPLYKDTLNKLSAKTLDTWRQRTTSIAQQLGLTSFIAKYMPKSKAGIKAKIERELSEAQDTYFDSKEKKQIEGLQKEVANQSDPNFAEKINKLVMDEVNRIGKALKGNEWVKKTNEALDEIMDDLKDC